VRVIVNVDTDVHNELINNRFAYVSISRASHDAQIYTNDTASLAHSLGRDVSKASAIDLSKGLDQKRNMAWDQAVAVKQPLASGLGVSL